MSLPDTKATLSRTGVRHGMSDPEQVSGHVKSKTLTDTRRERLNANLAFMEVWARQREREEKMAFGS